MSDDPFFVICSLGYSSPPHCYKYIKSQEHLPLHVWEQHKKKKKSPLCERVRGSAYEKKGRLRPHLYQSALHLSTGPQWISRLYTNASDIQHNVKEVFSTERVSQVRLFGGAPHKARSFPGFFLRARSYLSGSP